MNRFLSTLPSKRSHEHLSRLEVSESPNWIFETFVSTESEPVTLREIKEKGVKNKFGQEFTRGGLHNHLTNQKLVARVERNLKDKYKDDLFLLLYER